jgi:hypothetical protein
VIGGAGAGTGQIRAANVASVTFGGSLRGGSGSNSGAIICGSDLGLVKIGRDLIGGNLSSTATANLDKSGYIEGGHVAGVVIGGSLIDGRDDSAAFQLRSSGAIRAGSDLGPIMVKGSLIGNETNSVLITAVGQESPGSAEDLAIAKISIGGRVERAQILAGYDTAATPTATNADASIGPVSVSGDWIASNLVAGAADGADNLFGTADDTPLAVSDSPDFIARIAKVTIKGFVIGTAASGDHFGFVAQQFGAFKAGVFAAQLTSGLDVIELSQTTGDVTLREL